MGFVRSLSREGRPLALLVVYSLHPRLVDIQFAVQVVDQVLPDARLKVDSGALHQLSFQVVRLVANCPGSARLLKQAGKLRQPSSPSTDPSRSVMTGLI
jgi:hypothetical protein